MGNTASEECSGNTALKIYEEDTYSVFGITLCFFIALSAIMCLWAIGLRTIIFYGDYKLNKVSFQKLDVTIVACAVKVVYFNIRYFSQAQYFCFNEEASKANETSSFTAER